MNLNNNEKRYPCPPEALFRPSRFRLVYLPINLLACSAAIFFKARAAESWPWIVILLAVIFVFSILATEIWISARFSRYLVPTLYGFLAGAGVNVIIQGLLGRLQGLNWAFQSPIQFSLGAVLFGFLGSLIFIHHGDRVKKIWMVSPSTEGNDQSRSLFRSFSAVVLVVTVVMVMALYISLVIIQKQFGELESENPMRKPLWFSAGAILLIFFLIVLARKNILRLANILVPGLVVGLVWSSIIRDIFEGVYLAYPQFPVASEVLEVLLVMNFCYLGIAWLNRAAFDGS